MKLRSPLFVFAIVIIAILAVLTSLHADVIGTGPAPDPVILPTPKSPVYAHIGALNLTLPWENINVVYLFDMVERQNLVGGEAVIATLWRLQATVGAVTSIEGQGSPFVGGNLWFENPIPAIAILGQIKPGIFGGYNFSGGPDKKGQAMLGFKAAFPIFDYPR